MKNVARVAAFTLATTLMASVAVALPTGPLQIGDKIFDDFDVTGIDKDDVQVYVVGTGTPDDLYGIRIEGDFVSPIGGQADFRFYYTVRTASGEPLIAGITQSFNLKSIEAGGTVGIGETVFDTNFGVGKVAQSSVGALLTGDFEDPEAEPSQFDDLIIDPPVSKVWVTKDIYVTGNQGGSAGATIIWQRFVQNSVPDGGSMLILFGSALSLLRLIKSRIA